MNCIFIHSSVLGIWGIQQIEEIIFAFRKLFYLFWRREQFHEDLNDKTKQKTLNITKQNIIDFYTADKCNNCTFCGIK